MSGSVRLDKWLWAVRVYKTRSQANTACSAGRVTVNGVAAKPAHQVAIGDMVEARRRDRTIIYKVIRTIDKRVGAAVAAAAYVDESPPRPKDDLVRPAPAAQRDRGTGRPTKRDRRKLDQFRDSG